MDTIVYVIIALHVVCALALVLCVLLHSGKGTGVSSLFGASMPAGATGTGVVESNLTRITIGFGVGYVVTALLLMLFYRPGA